MNEKYEFMNGGFVKVADTNNCIDTDIIEPIRLRDERDKTRLDYVDMLRREEKLMSDYVSALRKIDRMERSEQKAKTIKNVIFNPPATIVFWADGTKTIVKCQDDEAFFDPEKGLAMAFMKKMLGNKGNYYNTVNNLVKSYWQAEHDKNLLIKL